MSRIARGANRKPSNSKRRRRVQTLLQLPRRCSCHAAFPSEAATPSAAQERSSARSKRSKTDESQRRQSDDGLKGQWQESKNIYHLFVIFFVVFFLFVFGLWASIDWSCQKAFCHIPHVPYVRSEVKREDSRHRETEREREAEWDPSDPSSVLGSASQHFCFQASRSDRWWTADPQQRLGSQRGRNIALKWEKRHMGRHGEQGGFVRAEEGRDSLRSAVLDVRRQMKHF